MVTNYRSTATDEYPTEQQGISNFQVNGNGATANGVVYSQLARWCLLLFHAVIIPQSPEDPTKLHITGYQSVNFSQQT
jgi:hypothetical protein